MKPNELSHRIIGAAIRVHKFLGPGLLESVYEECLHHELTLSGLSVQRQLQLPVTYRGLEVSTRLRMDLLVEDTVLVELKTVEKVLPVHEAQVLTYLRLGRWPIGLLLNFNTTVLRNGIRRKVLDLPEPSSH